MPDAKIIQMFKSESEQKPPQHEGDDEFEIEQVLTEEFMDDLHAVRGHIEDLFASQSKAEFETRLLAIKEQVAGWPGGTG
jgi:hypothetical protein